jgi:hypothetical protein
MQEINIILKPKSGLKRETLLRKCHIKALYQYRECIRENTHFLPINNQGWHKTCFFLFKTKHSFFYFKQFFLFKTCFKLG